MEQPINLKEYKIQLRKKFKERRKAMSPQRKERADIRISERLRSLYCYRKSKTVLCYVSTAIEVDTAAIISNALTDKKRVAVPRCIHGTREMEFYFINSIDELTPRTFGVLEPDDNPEKMVTDFSDSICIVPALACDRNGYRLGYGGGYYDRFLRRYNGEKILILYKNCLLEHLWHGRFDVRIDRIVTEYFTANIAKNDR